MKYHLVQLGCQMNRADAERIRTVLEGMGHQPCDNEEDAGILGLVACSVRQKAIDKVYSRISKWNAWKLRRPLLTFLSGCVLDEDRKKLADRFDLVFPVEESASLPDMIAGYGVPLPGSAALAGPVWMRTDPDAHPALPAVPGLSRTRAGSDRRETWTALRDSTRESVRALQALLPVTDAPVPAPTGPGPSAREAREDHRRKVEGFWDIVPRPESPFEAFVPIQNGCDKFCTYCAVPYTRGREVSRPSEEILTEVERLVQEGYTCINLLGQNVNSWGRDHPEWQEDFAGLLERIGALGDRSHRMFRVYFTSPHPRDMDRPVLEAMARHDSLGKQVHLPLQSGSDTVLERMNRKHGLERYREIAGWIRELMPRATLFTDIITGFTGETDTEFRQTLEAMEEFRFQMAFIAQYSPRPGAVSHEWPDDVPHETKKERLHALTGVLHRTSLSWNQARVGQEELVLTDSADREPGWYQGRTEGRIQIRFRSPALLQAGSWVKVRVTGARPLALEGEAT